MSLQYNPTSAIKHVTRADPVMADLIRRVGPYRLETEFALSPFEALLRAIVYQQLAGTAAAAIHTRLLALFRGSVTPRKVLNKDEATFRSAGLSRNKTLAIYDLAEKSLDGTVPSLDAIHLLDDDALVDRLTSVRGVGRWTVEMMMIFTLGRANVLPVADLGIRKGYHFAYNTAELPTADELVFMARHRLCGLATRTFRCV